MRTDIVEEVESYTSLFADDAKILKQVKKNEDCDLLQKDLNKIYKWSRNGKWNSMLENAVCWSLGKAKINQSEFYKLGEENIQKRSTEKGLSVIVMDDMSPGKYINKIVGELTIYLKNIRMAFSYIDEDMKKIIVTLIHPRLKYATVVWSLNLKKDIKKLERIQWAATKMVQSLKDLLYEDSIEVPETEKNKRFDCNV